MINIILGDCIGCETMKQTRVINTDLRNIVTPLKVDILEKLLIESNYNQRETQFLVRGFKRGFDIEYAGPSKHSDTARNLPLSIGSEEELWEKMIKEVKVNRFAGPFEEIPFDEYIQSPAGLVPKAGGRTRLIFHLSHNFKQSGLASVNAFTPKDKCTVKYKDIDYAVNTCFRCTIKENETLYFGKTDVTSAFRLVPLARKCWKYLILKAKDPESGQWRFFVDKCLPFGSSISCLHFQRLSDALRHIVEYKMRTPMAVTNYLDDFSFVATTVRKCNYLIKTFMAICQDLGILIAQEKTVWVTSEITFLGIVMDSRNWVLSIPDNKRTRALNLLRMADKKKATVEEIQKLAGFLNFLGRAIFPGRAFTRRMYSKFSGIIDGKKALKKYHHVKLNREFKQDCNVWIDFLGGNDSSEQIRSVMKRPFVDLCKEIDEKEVLNFYTDTSGNFELGFGCMFDMAYVVQQWDTQLLKSMKPAPSIEFLKLYALCVGVFTWAEKLKDRRCVIFCDNQAVVNIINSTSSSVEDCMRLIRRFVLKSLQMNFRITARYIASKDNEIADMLSRLNWKKFAKLKEKHNLNHHATTPSMELWPMDTHLCEASPL